MGTELENKSIVRRLDVVEEIVAELPNKVQENKPTASKASSNNRVVLRVCRLVHNPLARFCVS